METNKASNLRRMPLNVMLISLFGDGVNLALRRHISVSPKLCLTRLSKTWKRLCRVLRSNKFTTVYNSVFTCTLLVKLYNKNTSDPCSNLTDHTVTSRTTHLGKTLFISCNYNDLFLTHARTVAYLHLCDNKTKWGSSWLPRATNHETFPLNSESWAE